MSPRRLDWRAVQPKLRKIDELLGRLHQLGEFDEERLQTDHVDTLAVERILTLVVDLEIDYAQVAAAIPLALRDYGEYVRQAAQWMREQAERDE